MNRERKEGTIFPGPWPVPVSAVPDPEDAGAGGDDDGCMAILQDICCIGS